MKIAQLPGDEEFLLALLNSTPVLDGAPRDELGTEQTGRAWLAEHGQPDSAAEWRQARLARAALQAVVRGEAAPSSLRPLLRGLSAVPTVEDEAGLSWELRAPQGRSAAVRAVLAWDELRRSRPGRLRPCENRECALFLIDRSKSNRARWCSMAVCGNRMKARRHYERSRAGLG